MSDQMNRLDFSIEPNTITLERYSGTESFQVLDAACVFYTDEQFRQGITVRIDETKTICLNDFKEDIQFHDPDLEAYFVLLPLKMPFDEVVGQVFEIPERFDEATQQDVTWLYYSDHFDLSQNVIRFEEISENQIRVKWIGTTIDPLEFNKPEATFRADFWANIQYSN